MAVRVLDATARGRLQRVVVALAVALTMGLTLGGATAPAAATEATDDASTRAEALGLEVVAGFDGHTVRSAWTPVTVVMEPDRPIRADLVVASPYDLATTLQSREVEVAAGVRKSFPFLVPGGADRIQVQVTVLGENGEPLVVRPRLARTSGILVGLVGGLDVADGPAFTLDRLDEPATYVAVDDPILDLGARALDGLDAIAVRQGDLVDLDEAQRTGIAEAVTHGLQLVVTEVSSTDLGLPWQPFTAIEDTGLVRAPGAWAASLRDLEPPAPDGAARGGPTPTSVAAMQAGRGRVAVTTFGFADPGVSGVWAELLQPTGAVRGGIGEYASPAFAANSTQLFQTSTGQPPSLVWLALFLVAFLVIAGPVTGFVLRRRGRPELAWAVVPVVTAVFVAGAFVGASGTRPAVGVSGRAAMWIDGVGSTVSMSALRAPTAGDHTITLPGQDWQVVAGGNLSRARVSADEATDTVATAFSLSSQSLGGVTAWRTIDDAPPMAVEVAIVDGQARVEVTNTSDVVLRSVRLQIGGTSSNLAGQLDPGQTHTEAIDLPARPQQTQNTFFNWFDRRQGRDTALAMQAGIAAQMMERSVGIAWVSAAADDPFDLGLPTIDERAPIDAGTFIAVGVTPTPTDDGTSGFEVQATPFVNFNNEFWTDGIGLVGGFGQLPIRFRLPHEGTATAVTFDVQEANPFGGREMAPLVPGDCVDIERRNGSTDQVIETVTVCDGPGEANELLCPEDADFCFVSEFGDGEVCFPDGGCEVFRPLPRVDDDPTVPTGLEAWDRLARTWVVVEPDGTTAPGEIERWMSPLGEVWVRPSGDIFQFDLFAQSVQVTVEAAS